MTPNPFPLDQFNRPLRSLRISVTDRCNLRCHYCMPEQEYVWLPRQSLLSFEEMYELALVFADLGVQKLRITGGEPLLRKDLPVLIARLAGSGRFRDIALTTNGLLLHRHAAALKDAGLNRVTLSLDTLRADRFKQYSRGSRLEDVFAGLAAVNAVGFTGTKINGVITRGDNDDEVLDLFAFASEHQAEMRFIEYMDVGGATHWSMAKVVSRADVLGVFTGAFGSVTPLPRGSDASAPAEQFAIPDGRQFGIVASTTSPFCRDCDRGRITADGRFFTCLYTDDGLDLREALRSDKGAQTLSGVIRSAWSARRDRGAEERAAVPDRGALYQLSGLRSKPHREMHTRGG